MRLAISGDAKEGLIVASIHLTPDTGSEPWDLGELKFTLDEWTEFVAHFGANDTVIGFDIHTTDGEKVLL